MGLLAQMVREQMAASANHKEETPNLEEERKKVMSQCKRLSDEDKAKAKGMIKINAEYTYVRIIALDTGKDTTIRVLASKYSSVGEKEERIELPTFDYPFNLMYNTLVSHYTSVALEMFRIGQESLGINVLSND